MKLLKLIQETKEIIVTPYPEHLKDGIPESLEFKKTMIKIAMTFPVFSFGNLHWKTLFDLQQSRIKNKEGRDITYQLPYSDFIIHFQSETGERDIFQIVSFNGIDTGIEKIINSEIQHLDDFGFTYRWAFDNRYPNKAYIDSHFLGFEESGQLYRSDRAISPTLSFEEKYHPIDYEEMTEGEEFEYNLIFDFLFIMNNEKMAQEIKTIQPTPKEMKIATKKRKLPPISYKTLDLNIWKKDSIKTGYKFPNRQKPSEHLRRGHIRRYKTGVTINIKPQTINEGAERKTIKDYNIKI